MDETSRDLLLLGARIHPLGDHPAADALLVRGGRVAAVGSEAEVRAAASPGTPVERLEGATVTPGITDAHVHLTAWAFARRQVALAGVRTAEEAARRVSEAAGAGGEGWILGQGWDRNRLGALPTREILDAAAPRRAVLLQSHDIHTAWLSTEALRRAAIDRSTPDPEGGEIVRDPVTGEPTGVLLENACALALGRVPAPTAAETLDAVREAVRELGRLGVTGVHSVEPSGLRDFRALQAEGGLTVRVLQHFVLPQLDDAIAAGLRSGMGAEEGGAGDWIRHGGVKMFLDGALGSRTAWMREPYEGAPDNRGIQTLRPDRFREIVSRAAAAGIAATVHAIGDAAVELALDVLSSITPPAALPHRIEHLQLCPPELWERVGRSGVVASMQPVHLLSDLFPAERHWGHERSRGAYAFRPLLEAGAILAFGSDVPVETVDPRPGLFAAVRRVSWEGEPAEGWYPGHALTAEQALRGYTEGPARASGEADRRGRLLPGYDADLVAWDRDPLAVPAEELREMRPLLTVVGGRVVHREGA